MALTVGTNSWISLASADSYFSDRISTTDWDALSDTDKEKYLVTAFRWIYYDSAFSVPLSSTENAVQYGQCEAALFLVQYYEEMRKREALAAGGVKSFDYGERSEDLTDVKKPATVINYFTSIGFYNAGVSIATFTNSETDY